MDDALKEKTRKTAQMLFHTIKSGVGFDTWKKFDKELARELSMFFTGKLYSREVISQKQRELCAVASLTVLNRRNEVRAHIHAALNVGATRQEVAEVIFQQVTYGGMPVVVEALEVFKDVLAGAGRMAGVTACTHGRRPPPIAAARAAGEVALRYYRGGFEVTIKPDQTPVTQADREAEQAIKRDPGARLSRRRVPRRGVRGGGPHRPAVDHRSHRRHQELHPAGPDLGGAHRPRGGGAR